MWTFKTLPYTRPDADALKASIAASIQAFRDAATVDAAEAVLLSVQQTMGELHTMLTLAYVRNTIDMTDAFYEEEVAVNNRLQAELSPLQKQWNEALLGTPHRAALEARYGKRLFILKEMEASTQSEAIVADLVAESELGEEYKKLTAGCQVVFGGETCNFYGLLKHMESPDRTVRREAFIAWAGLYESIAGQLDEIYDKLIVIRERIAKTLGFDGFTPLAYARMERCDYAAKDVAQFRQQVRDVIVPAAAKYREQQAKRIGVDKLRFYDEAFVFPDGNADPIGDEDVLLPIAKRMYHELSRETGVFFDFMLEHELFDLKTKPGKHLGGYCTDIATKKAPFIFANFNGTAADVGVLTHEAGHAFADYRASREQQLLEYVSPSVDIAEIHSMTMEHFTYPWLGSMYGESQAKKAKYAHLCDALLAIPYLVAVDEFQHRVFENSGMSAAERRALWKEIEQTYMPWRDYDGVAFLEEGGFWMQKQHIFLYPFYYIDYALAQICAFAFYSRMQTEPEDAWKDYLTLCDAGGSLGYFELLKLANLPNPFEPGAVFKAVERVIQTLDEEGWA